MRFNRSLGVAFAIVASVAVALTGATTAQAVETESKYIVQVPDGQMGQLTNALAEIGETADKKFYQGPDAATATLSATDAQKLAIELPQAQIVKDHPIYLASAPSTEQPGAAWHLRGLNASSSNTPSAYTYPASAGADVDVYVIDSGVDVSAYANPGDELHGRITNQINFAIEANPSSPWHSSTNGDDCYVFRPPWNDSSAPSQYWGGHGTHVAGIIASATYGVAKSVNIIPERVFGCPEPVSGGNYAPSSSASLIYQALDWAMEQQRLSGLPSVINMSLGGALDATLNSKVQTAISRGITVVSAAGNSQTNACNSSPASAANGITVGAIGSGYSFASSYSNFGSCVSVLAPGSGISSVAAWGGSTSMSGTSMAAPIVSGVAALYLSLNRTASPDQVKSAIVSQSLVDRVTGVPSGTTNRLVNTNFVLSTMSVGTMNPPTTSALSPSQISLRWNAIRATADGVDSSVTDSQIRYRVAGSPTWLSYAHTSLGSNTSITVNGLLRNTTYEFQVAGTAGSTYGNYSATSRATTLSGVASAVRGMWSSRYTRSIRLTWAGPATTNGGGAVTDYAVYYRRQGTSKWIRFNDGVSSRNYATVSGLRRYTTYQFFVTPVTRYGTGTNAFINARTR